jgi:chaperonin GroEL (HSP60 family)
LVLEKKFGAPYITKNGVSVTREIELADTPENTGVPLRGVAASKTADAAGGGTTTTTFLAQDMIHFGPKNLTAGANARDLKRRIDKAIHEVGRFLKNQAEQVEVDDPKIAGVIDPVAVGGIALEPTASIAGMVLTTACAISKKPEKSLLFPLRMAVMKIGYHFYRGSWGFIFLKPRNHSFFASIPETLVRYVSLPLLYL